MSLRRLILDYDGPILEGSQRHWRCYADILEGWGYTPMPLEKYWAMKRERADRRRQLAESGAESRYDDFLKEWLLRIEDKKYLGLDKIQPGATEKLSEWKTRGLRLSLVTMRQNEAMLFWQLETLGLTGFFDDICAVGISDSEGAKIAAVEKLFSASGRSEALWIGDTEVDVKSAKALGIKICALKCGLRTGDYLAGLKPDMLLPDLRSIAI